MSSHTVKRPEAERLNLTRLGMLPMGLLVIGIILTAGCLGAACVSGKQYAFAWLAGMMFVFTICIGSLFWVLLHHAIDTNWTVAVRRVFETIAASFSTVLWVFPVLIGIFLVCCADDLFKWYDGLKSYDAHAKYVYFDKSFFWGRQIAYAITLIVTTYVMFKLSVKQDETGDHKLSLRMRKISYGFIPLFVLTITFTAIDWLMSLDYHWFSTMWGVYIFAGAVGSAMATTILIVNALRAAGYLKGVATVEHNHIMGKLLFAFTIFWAYTGFSQFMLIQYANIPEETIFFVIRNTQADGSVWGWYSLSLFLVFGRFFFPFLLLLTQPAKQNPIRICFAAGWILFMHLIDMFWIVMPQFHLNYGLKKANLKGVEGGIDQFLEGVRAGEIAFAPGILDFVLVFASAIGLICLLSFFVMKRFSENCLFPVRDPRLYESVTIKN